MPFITGLTIYNDNFCEVQTFGWRPSNLNTSTKIILKNDLDIWNIFFHEKLSTQILCLRC